MAAVECTVPQLTTSGGWQGATGTLLGGIAITNEGQAPCSLGGYLEVSLHDEHGNLLNVEVVHTGIIGTDGALDGPEITAPVVLPRGKADSAVIALRWSNWCGPSPGSTVVVDLTVNGTTFSIPSGVNSWGVTTCLGAQEPSVLEEGPVQQQPG
jgi:hypothetical protein